MRTAVMREKRPGLVSVTLPGPPLDRRVITDVYVPLASSPMRPTSAIAICTPRGELMTALMRAPPVGATSTSPKVVWSSWPPAPPTFGLSWITLPLELSRTRSMSGNELPSANGVLAERHSAVSAANWLKALKKLDLCSASIWSYAPGANDFGLVVSECSQATRGASWPNLVSSQRFQTVSP